MLKWYYVYSRLAYGTWFWLLKPGWWLKSSRRKCCLIFWQTQKVLFIIMSNNGTACFLEHSLEITFFFYGQLLRKFCPSPFLARFSKFLTVIYIHPATIDYFEFNLCCDVDVHCDNISQNCVQWQNFKNEFDLYLMNLWDFHN